MYYTPDIIIYFNKGSVFMKAGKKILAVFCAAGILAASLAGCTGSKYSPPDLSSRQLTFTSENEEQLKKLTDGKLSTCVTLEKGKSVEFDLGGEKTFDQVILSEKGDNLNKFTIAVHSGEKWETVYEGDRILEYRLCYVGDVKADKIRITAEDCVEPVQLSEVQVRESAVRTKNVKVSQYLCFDESFDQMAARTDDSFSGYYNVVTDAIIIGSVFLDDQGKITVNGGEEKFAQRMEAFRKAIGSRNVNIWITVGFDMKDSEGNRDHDATAGFVNEKIDSIVESVKAFTEKYGIYGVDYDWEYPQKSSQWKAYDKMITETSKVTKVSIALPPWGIKLSDEAVNALEHVNVMAYDLFDERGDHANSFTAGWDAVRKVNESGIPMDKILLGVPTYGRTTDKSGDAWPTYKDYDLGKWGNFIADYPYKTADGQEKTCDAYLNSYGQVRDKTALAISCGAGGIMIFREGCDSDYTEQYCLHKAVEEVISATTK